MPLRSGSPRPLIFGFSREGIMYQIEMTRFLQAIISLPRRLGHGLRGQDRTSRLASLGYPTVPTAFPGFALWGATSTYQAGVAIRHATELSNAFEAGRYTVGTESSLERKYRFEPGQAVLSRYQAGAADMLAARQRGRTIGAPADPLLTDNVSAKQLLN